MLNCLNPLRWSLIKFAGKKEPEAFSSSPMGWGEDKVGCRELSGPYHEVNRRMDLLTRFSISSYRTGVVGLSHPENTSFKIGIPFWGSLILAQVGCFGNNG